MGTNENIKKDMNKELGRRLKEVLKVTSHSKDDLKNLLEYRGTGYAQINNLLAGQHGLRRKQIERISTEWDIRIEYLECKDDFITEDDLYSYERRVAHNEYLIKTKFLELIGLEVKPSFYWETTIPSAHKYYKETSPHLLEEDRKRLDEILRRYKEDLDQHQANISLVKALIAHKYFELINYICEKVNLQQEDVNAKYEEILKHEENAREKFGNVHIDFINDNGFGFTRGYEHCLRYIHEGNCEDYKIPKRLSNLLNKEVNENFKKNKKRVLYFVLDSLPEWVSCLDEKDLKKIAYNFDINKSFNMELGGDTCLVKIGFLVKNGKKQILLSYDDYFAFLDVIVGNAQSLMERIYDNNSLRNMSHRYEYIDFF